MTDHALAATRWRLELDFDAPEQSDLVDKLLDLAHRISVGDVHVGDTSVFASPSCAGIVRLSETVRHLERQALQNGSEEADRG